MFQWDLHVNTQLFRIPKLEPKCKRATANLLQCAKSLGNKHIEGISAVGGSNLGSKVFTP